eukprot:4215946-Pyramimonas_sp.AAC.1
MGDERTRPMEAILEEIKTKVKARKLKFFILENVIGMTYVNKKNGNTSGLKVLEQWMDENIPEVMYKVRPGVANVGD